MEPLVYPLITQLDPWITPRPRIEECADVQQWINICDEMNKAWIGELVKGAQAQGMDIEEDEGMDIEDGAARVPDEAAEMDAGAGGVRDEAVVGIQDEGKGYGRASTEEAAASVQSADPGPCRPQMQVLFFAATGREAGRGSSVHGACKDFVRKEGPLHEYHLIHADGVQLQRATHEGPIQDLTLVMRSGNEIGKLKYKKLKRLPLRLRDYRNRPWDSLVVSVSPGFRFMTPHKRPMVCRARRLWRSRMQRPDTLTDRRWYREILEETEAHERCTLGNVNVPMHLSAIAECSQCYVVTTVLGAAMKNWRYTGERGYVCHVCVGPSHKFLCHCGWCQAPLFFCDKGNANCRPQGVQSLLCCAYCSMYHYGNCTGG